MIALSSDRGPLQNSGRPIGQRRWLCPCANNCEHGPQCGYTPACLALALSSSPNSADKISVNLPSIADKARYNLDFSGSSLNFDCELNDGDEWGIFRAANDSQDDQIFCGLDNANSIMLNDDELTQSDDFIFEGSDYMLEYRFVEEGDTTYGMLVASKLA